MRDFLLFGHLLGVFILLGGVGVSTTLGIRSMKLDDVKTLKWITDVVTINGRFVVTGGMVLAIVFGAVLVDETGHEMSEAWISAAFLISIVSLGLVHGILLKRIKLMGARCEELLAAGTTTTSEFQGTAQSKKMAVTGIANNVLLLVMLWLMVAQPGA